MATEAPKIVETAERAWEVKLPPKKKQMIGGKLVPTVRGAFGFATKKRRLVMEIIGPKSLPETTPPSLRGMSRSDKREVNGDLSELLDDEADRVVVRILKPRKYWGLSRDSDDSGDEDGDDEPGMSDEVSLESIVSCCCFWLLLSTVI